MNFYTVLLFFIFLQGAFPLSAQGYISLDAQFGYSKPIGLEDTQRATAYDLRAVRTGYASIQYNLIKGKNKYSIHLMGTALGFRQYIVFPFTDSTNYGSIIGNGLPTDVEQTVIYHYRGIGLGYGRFLNKNNILNLHLAYLKIEKIVTTVKTTFPNPDPVASFSFAISEQYTFDDPKILFANNQWNCRLVFSHKINQYFYLNCSYSSGLNRFVNFEGQYKDKLILHQFIGLGLEFCIPKFRKKRF